MDDTERRLYAIEALLIEIFNVDSGNLWTSPMETFSRLRAHWALDEMRSRAKQDPRPEPDID